MRLIKTIPERVNRYCPRCGAKGRYIADQVEDWDGRKHVYYVNVYIRCKQCGACVSYRDDALSVKLEEDLKRAEEQDKRNWAAILQEVNERKGE